MLVVLAWTDHAGRACNVFGLSALVNTRRTTNKINFKQQFVSFWSGLRGAIAFALCLSFPSDYYRCVVELGSELLALCRILSPVSKLLGASTLE